VLHHVAFAIPQLARGGATQKNGGPDGVFLTLLTNLDRARFRATLIVGDASDGDLIRELPADVQVVDLQTNAGRFRPRVASRYPVRRLARAINDLEPDAVLATLRMDLTLAATRSLVPETTAFISRAANNIGNERVTLSASSTLAKQRLQAWWYERAMVSSDMVIAQSRSMERDIAELFGSEVAAKTVTLPNPIDLIALEKRAASAPPHPRAGFPQVVTVGRLDHQKGYDLLIEAFRRVREVWPEAHLRIIGEGVQRAELEARRNALDLTDAVELVGFADNPFGYLRSADIYVCSSRYEGFSNALAEAVGTGLPAVAPVGPAAGDEIVNPEFGALIPTSEPILLAQAILELVERLPSFDRSTISADLGERLSCREVVHRYEDSIEQAIDSRRARLQPGSRRATPIRGRGDAGRSLMDREGKRAPLGTPQTSSAPITMPRPAAGPLRTSEPSPKFSVCIPNYNYASYIGETIDSVLSQTFTDLEVRVVDNASTDRSVHQIELFDDERLHLTVNRSNVGFAGNLDRAVSKAAGEWAILLSSDDLMEPTALETYARLIAAIGERAATSVISATCIAVDGDNRRTGRLGPAPWCWRDEDVDQGLTRELGVVVYRKSSGDVLRRSLTTMRNPTWFASTAYPMDTYRRIEGYRGRYLTNPDKDFHWRAIAASTDVYFIDDELFRYRVHESNQSSLERESGDLKRLVDQYMMSFMTEPEVLETAGLTKADLARAFVREDIGKRSFLALLDGEPRLAKRLTHFGRAAYPRAMRRDVVAQAAAALALFGPVTSPALRRFALPLFEERLEVWTLTNGAPSNIARASIDRAIGMHGS